jgi:peptidoglycan/LPS O-acetylase OafA/YrhL
MSGAVVNGALWLVAENAWNAIGAAAAGVMSLGLGGHVNASPPTAYRWCAFGMVAGLLTGAAVGLGVGVSRREAGGMIAGALSALAVWALSAAVFAYAGGFESFYDESLLALAAVALVVTVVMGTFVGTMTDLLLKRTRRDDEGRSAL